MKELLGYMARHHDDLEKTFNEEQKEIFEKFHVARQKQLNVVFNAAKPPGATSWQSRAGAGDRQRLCDGGEKLERIYEPRLNRNLRICLPPRSAVGNGDTIRHKRITSQASEKASDSDFLTRSSANKSKLLDLFTNL